MAASDVTLRMLLTGEDRSASKALRGVGSEAGKTGGKMSKFAGVGKAAMLGVAGALVGVGLAAVDFGKDAVEAASRAEQSIGGVGAVFGKQSKEIEAAAAAAAKNLGLSANSYRELATVIGAGLKNKGIKDYAGESQKLIKVGADLAAQFGGSTQEAVDALSSAMRGESDPIEKYGVSLNESAIAAVLAANGQSKLKGAALDTAKAQARLKLITEQTSDAQGAFGRESDTLAGKQARAQARFENLQMVIGEKLLPVMEGLTEAGLGMLDWLEQNPEMVEGVSQAFDGLGGMMRWFWNNVLLPVVKFWIHSNAEVVKGVGMILEATGRLTGNKDMENFGKGIQKAATATQEWADGLRAIPDEVAPKIDARTEAAKKKVVELDGKIKGLKGKIVTAKAKGDDKELERLRKKLLKFQREKFAAKITVGVTMNKARDEVVYNVTGQGNVKFTARRRGGPIRAGQPYWVGEDGPEPFFPGVSGHMLSNMQARSMPVMAGAGSMGGGAGGEVHHWHHVQIDGNVDELATGRQVVKAINSAVIASGGKGVTIREGWRR